MAECDAFYEVFWLLPTVPLPAPREISTLSEPLPESVLRRRSELRTALASLGLSDSTQLRGAIGYCDQYIQSLRSTQTISEVEGKSTWSSAIVEQSSAMPLAFEEPMALVLQATLLLNLGASVARARTLPCISESAHCFCQAAGVLEDVIVALDGISSTFRTDVPVEIPELAPRILHALVDMALVLAQQLAIVKASLHGNATRDDDRKAYRGSVLQKLHVACQLSFENFETAVVRSCYSASPRRHGCATLLGFSGIFSRLHRATSLQLESEAAFHNGRVGDAIACVRAAARQLQERQSMRDAGLAPLDASDGVEQHSYLVPLLVAKRESLQTTDALWTKDNDAIYFAIIPTEESVLSMDFSHALIMKVGKYEPNGKRLGSVRSELSREDGDASTTSLADMVTTIHVGGDNADNGEDREDREDGEDGDEEQEEDAAKLELEEASTPVSRGENGHTSATESSALEPLSVPVMGTSLAPLFVAASDCHDTTTATSSSKSQSSRRMASPHKAATSRKLLGNIGKLDSLVVLHQTEEHFKSAVTDEAVLKIKCALHSGVDVYRLTKDKWKKEILRVQSDHLMLVRKNAIAMLLSKQLKIPWNTVHAFQHELQPVNQVLQLLAPPGQRMTSILVITERGDSVEPMEITLATPDANACAVACLQQMLESKRNSISD